MRADPVADREVAALDADRDPVSVGDGDLLVAA
jgi:hypothetical protein